MPEKDQLPGRPQIAQLLAEFQERMEATQVRHERHEVSLKEADATSSSGAHTTFGPPLPSPRDSRQRSSQPQDLVSVALGNLEARIRDQLAELHEKSFEHLSTSLQTYCSNLYKEQSDKLADQIVSRLLAAPYLHAPQQDSDSSNRTTVIHPQVSLDKDDMHNQLSRRVAIIERWLGVTADTANASARETTVPSGEARCSGQVAESCPAIHSLDERLQQLEQAFASGPRGATDCVHCNIAASVEAYVQNGWLGTEANGVSDPRGAETLASPATLSPDTHSRGAMTTRASPVMAMDRVLAPEPSPVAPLSRFAEVTGYAPRSMSPEQLDAVAMQRMMEPAESGLPGLHTQSSGPYSQEQVAGASPQLATSPRHHAAASAGRQSLSPERNPMGPQRAGAAGQAFPVSIWSGRRAPGSNSVGTPAPVVHGTAGACSPPPVVKGFSSAEVTRASWPTGGSIRGKSCAAQDNSTPRPAHPKGFSSQQQQQQQQQQQMGSRTSGWMSPVALQSPPAVQAPIPMHQATSLQPRPFHSNAGSAHFPPGHSIRATVPGRNGGSLQAPPGRGSPVLGAVQQLSPHASQQPPNDTSMFVPMMCANQQSPVRFRSNVGAFTSTSPAQS
eukprot:TRINITY_DN19469_c1_g1_i1.p1 TRINITY_DN19469_c1_g1~~TRINITY_DN19469_c1_g1_i1.p1  ORF type:complete len:616 (+),score=81.72 TRINITY_DN19469_c1_g1_i1:87-1934(+)